MTATRIALIRHGETDWNAQLKIQGQTDIPLNETGLAQAQRAADRLRVDDYGTGVSQWHRVFTSPLSRAAQTASIISAHLEVEDLVHREELIERFFGAAEGLPPGPELDAVRLANGEFLDAETEFEVGSRGAAALEALHLAHPGENLIAVSHGSYIRCTLDVLFQMKAPRIANTAVTMLHRTASGWSLSLLNDEPVSLSVVDL